MKSRTIRNLLIGMALCLWGATSVSAQVTRSVERPDTTDLDAFLEYYRDKPDSNEKYEAYLWALHHIDTCDPTDWQNKMRILNNIGNMFCGIKDFVHAKEYMDENGFKELGGKHYCGDCWHYDDDDNIVTKDGRKFNGDTEEEIL